MYTNLEILSFLHRDVNDCEVNQAGEVLPHLPMMPGGNYDGLIRNRNVSVLKVIEKQGLLEEIKRQEERFRT